MTVFPAIRIEGGLLGPDLLDQLLAAELPGQRPADFGLDGKRGLTDEIAAAFADARALWSVFQHRLEKLPEGDSATSVTRDAWMVPFLGLLGYESRFNPRAHEVDGLTFAVSHRAGEAEDSPPLHIVGAGQGLGQVPKSGRPRLAPHSLVQEYLNRTDHVWGIVTNGRILRLLRDSTFVRRQAYVEFDLEAMIEEQRFQDFAALYRLLHRTRLPRGMADASDCLLEKYHFHSEEQGGRVREHLSKGVEKCLTLFGNGFLRHKGNEELRRRVAPDCTGNDRITEVDFYRQLLRLVYRFLFLLVSEDRGLISDDPLYREHYGVARLRRLLDRRSPDADYDDVWQSLRVLWHALGDDKFGGFLQVAPLNGELFARQDLDNCAIGNRDLLSAFWHLAWYQEKSTSPRRVNYAALDVEELGSVYESLLEFHPLVERDTAGRVTFDLLYGSERKRTGSYYTPPQVVAELIRFALEPVLQDRLAARPNELEKAILSIRVCDPACGSGHFLLAAARRLGKELARVRSGEDEPAPEQVRTAIRDVISHCIYGVDKNPLAVDLCRVALWLEGHTAGRPLTFLDHRIRCGDSLVGIFDLSLLKEGIPDKAVEPLEGDDWSAARKLARRNREERTGQFGLFHWEPTGTVSEAARVNRQIDAISDDSPAAIARKKKLFIESQTDPAWRHQHEACDLWTAAFFQPITTKVPAITTGTVLQHLARGSSDPRLLGLARQLASTHRFFHWPLEYSEIFDESGFDVVLGNPPFVNVIEGGIPARSKRFVSSVAQDLGGTADLAFHFVRLAHKLARRDGRIGLVQPKTFLNSDSARGLRARLVTERPPVLIHVPRDASFFKGASSYVCFVVLGSASFCSVSESNSLDDVSWAQATILDDNWWRAIQETLGHYTRPKGDHFIALSDAFEVVASMTTGDAYEIKAFVRDDEAGSGPKLITTGLIDPFVCKWGQEPCRYLSKSYRWPRISNDLDISKSLLKRLRSATRPKLLVAGLCNRLEVYLDATGDCLGAVSTFSIYHGDDSVAALSQLCEWLNSEEASMSLRAELGAASVGGGYMTLKKKFLQMLPIPKALAFDNSQK